MTRLAKDEKLKIINKHDFKVLDKESGRGLIYEISKVDKEGKVTLKRIGLVDSQSNVDHEVGMIAITGTFTFYLRNLYIFQNKQGYFFSIRETIYPELSVILEKDLQYCKEKNIAFFKVNKDFTTNVPVKEKEVTKPKVETKTCSSKEKKDCKCPLKTIRKTVWNSIKSLFKKG